MLIGIQLYTLRDALSEDFEGTLKKIADIGYNGVELAGLYGKSPEEIKFLCKKYSLTPISAHVGIAEITNNENTLENYKKIGCEYIAIPWTNFGSLKTESEISALIDKIRICSLMAKETGLQMLYHNHDFEFGKLSDGTYFIDKLFASIPENLLATELDTCWVYVSGESPAEYILKYSSRAPLIHLHDFKKDENGNIEFQPVGKGIQDVQSILNACIKANTQWIIVEQDDPSYGANPLDEVKSSIGYLKNIL